jgi:serine/threonine-protein phosphatase PGAM5
VTFFLMGASAAAAATAPAPKPSAPASAARADTARTALGVHYLILIRHGIYDRDDRADDRVGNGLNPLGHEQARAAGVRLASLPVKPAALVSSDFTRARETADDIGRALGMTATRDTLLRECTPASDRPDLMREDTPGEIPACDSSMAAAWARYARPTPAADRHDVLVCHGNVIRWFVSRALGVDTRRWHAMDIANGSLTVIAVRPDGVTKLVTFSDVSHVDLAKQTWSGKGPGWGPSSAR